MATESVRPYQSNYKSNAECEECGAPFYARPSRRRKGKDRFCSRKCADENRSVRDMSGENNPNWKGGVSGDNMRYKRRQIKRYPEKVKARQAVQHALRSGDLERKPCRKCGSQKNLEAHHEDYRKALNVVWLCRSCHRAYHRDEIEIPNK